MLDAFVSLPLLSFFALPWLSSYSTSLNLLFFYMTWSILVLSYSSLKVELIGTLMARTVFYFLPALFFLLVDTAVPSLAANLKAHGAAALPGRMGAKKVAKVVGLSVFNILLGIALQGAVEVFLTSLKMRTALKITTRLPMPWSIFNDILWAFALRGLLSYYIHRFVLHGPSRSRYSLPYLHRTYSHSIRYPFSFSSAYDHPICYLLHRWVPLYLPAYAFRYHILTFQLLVALSSLEDVFAYSGYGSAFLPGTIVVNRMARRIDAHHMGGGSGNFGGFGVLDWAHGSSLASATSVVDDMAAEAEKHDLAGKVAHGTDAAGNALHDVGAKFRGRARRGVRARNDSE